MGAVTITLVKSGHDRMRYLMTAATTGTDTGTITTTGAATPDIKTDLGANQGPLLKIAKAFTDGYGTLPAGALIQANARALWLGDGTSGAPAIAGNLAVPVAMCRISPRGGAAGAWCVDANVDGGGHPTINITSLGVGVNSAYLDIFVGGAIGA